MPLAKDGSIATTSLFFPKHRGVPLAWGLAVSNNAEDLNWTLSSTSGMLEAGDMQEIMLTLDMTGIQARAAEYSTEFTLNTSSPTPTPIPISSTTKVVVRSILSASASAAASFVNLTNLARLAAGDSVDFTVTPVDATGMTILDPTDFAYFGMLTHAVSNTSVACRVGYDSVSNVHEGECGITSAVCTFGGVGSDECDTSPPVGAFTLGVNDAKGMVVGATLYSIIVASCPDTHYRRNGKCVQCPPHDLRLDT